MTAPSKPPQTIRTDQSSGPGRRVAWLLMAAGGWLVIIGLLAWGLLIDTDLTTDALAKLLRKRLSPGWEVQVHSIEFAPLNREVILQGVTLETPDGRLEIESLRLFIGWKPGRGIGIDGVVAQSGSAWISEGFLKALAQIESGDEAAINSADSPALQVAGFQLHLLTESNEWTDGGVLDLGAQKAQARWTVQGKLEGAPATQAPLWFHCTLDDQGTVKARTACDAVMLGHLQEQEWLPAPLREQPAHWQVAGSTKVRASVACIESGQPWDLHFDLDLEEGRAVLPPHDLGLAPASNPQDSNLTLRTAWDADLRLSPRGELQSFALLGQVELGLGDLRADVVVRAGDAAPAGQTLELWLTVPRVNWEQEMLPRLGLEATVTAIEGMLQPSGNGQALAWFSMPDGAWDSPRPATLIARQIAVLPLDGTSGAYHGDPNWDAQGQRNLGFPLRVEQISGAVHHGFVPERYLAEELALVQLRGQHPTGPARIEGMFRIRGLWLDEAPPKTPVPLVMLLSIGGDGLEVGETLYEGLDGLAGIEPVPQIRPQLDPHGGTLDFELILQKVNPTAELSTDLKLAIMGTSLQFEEGGIALNQAQGDVIVRVAPVTLQEQAGSVRFDLQGSSLPYASKTQLQGLVSFGPLPGRTSWLRLGLEGIDLSAPEVAELLNGADERVSAGFKDQLDGAACSAQAQAWRHSEDQPYSFEALLRTPDNGLSLQIPESEIAPLSLHGGATLSGKLDFKEEPGGAEISLGEGPRLALRLASPTHSAPLISLSSPPKPLASWHVQVNAAGINLRDPGVPQLTAPLAPRETSATGFVDASTLFQPGQKEPNGTLWLDCETISLPQFEEPLGPVRGPVHLTQDGLISSPGIEISLAGATARLSDLKIEMEGSRVLATTSVSAHDIPLEERQLNLLLGEETAQVLLDELQAKGMLSVESGTLTLLVQADQPTGVRFDGEVSLRDGSMSLGLPIEVQRMDRSLLTLISEGNQIRARVKVVDLDATIAGRSLEGASFQATFIEPRLAIEDFSAGFEGGRIASQGLAQAGTASFFSMDLATPFPFSLSTTVSGVDVGLLTRGVFQSEFANEGRLKGQLRLTGELGDLLGVQGSGRIELADSSLWAIPVFQVLFATLGFDSTATFGNMEAWLDLRDGVITMSGMRLKSDLLSLVGEGTLDMNGELNYSMEVRYSLVDKIGLLNKIIYLLQDELIRISIEGDMGRPSVLAKGLLSRFTTQARPTRRLPIPPLSTLPRVW